MAPEEATKAMGKQAAPLFSAPGFYFAKTALESEAAANALRSLGFKHADTTLLFSKPVVKGNPASFVRDAWPADEDGVGRVARESFSFSRFHRDPFIPVETANRLKEAWARNFFTGKRGDQMIVAEQDRKITGFLQLLKNQKTLTVDLIAVHPAKRSRGMAAAMIRYAENSNPNFEFIQAGTQEANPPSIALYEKLGFEMISQELVFHKHTP